MRWTAKRKAEIVVAIRDGDMSTAEATKRYELSDEEVAAWMRDYAAFGKPGLFVTKFQQQHYPQKREGRGGVRTPASSRGANPRRGTGPLR